MTVQGKFRLSDPGGMEANMEIKMTLNEWITIRDEFKNSKTYPAISFRRVIDSLIDQAEKTFFAYENKND